MTMRIVASKVLTTSTDFEDLQRGKYVQPKLPKSSPISQTSHFSLFNMRASREHEDLNMIIILDFNVKFKIGSLVYHVKYYHHRAFRVIKIQQQVLSR